MKWGSRRLARVKLWQQMVPDYLFLYTYFLALVLVGTLLLSRPFAANHGSVKLIDAFFTAMSAACVTGLSSVDAQIWSKAGYLIILILIQAGGMGILSFAMLYLVLPGMRVPIRGSRMLGEFSRKGEIVSPRAVIRRILLTVLAIEGMGALLLYRSLLLTGEGAPFFTAVFHSVSAFNNAGFSTYSNGAAGFESGTLFLLMLMIVLGGMGFSVISDVWRWGMQFIWRLWFLLFPGDRIRGKHKKGNRIRSERVSGRPLHFHSRLMLVGSLAFILIGAVGYMLDDAFPSGKDGIVSAFFQSVSTRTAGFNTVDQGDLSYSSFWLTLFLMLVGGGSGSTAGGIKISTAIILIFVLFRGVSEAGDLRIANRQISSRDVSRAAMFFLKAMALLAMSILLLGLVEKPDLSGFSMEQIIFECTSAFATVGLSMGITPQLSFWGKVIISFTMFAGRVGLFSIIIRNRLGRVDKLIGFPKGDVQIG